RSITAAGNQPRSPRARATAENGQSNYWRTVMANGWTSKRRAKQARAIQKWRPWERSTGPRTAEGKKAARGNAWKGGERQTMRELARLLRAQTTECPKA